MSKAPSWIIAPDASALNQKAAHLFIESVSNAIHDRGHAAVAISGGRGPEGFLTLLASSYYASRVDWLKVHVFFVDERCVPPTHAESNFALAERSLFTRLSIPQQNIHRIQGEITPPQEAAKAYENELKSFFKSAHPFPVFDFIQLGMGEDGHTASLFPQSEALKETHRWVLATEAPVTPKNRITLTLPVLNDARRVLFLIAGTSKAERLKSILIHDPQQESRLPALRVTPHSGEILWLFDKEAASRLPAEVRFQAFHL